MYMESQKFDLGVLPVELNLSMTEVLRGYIALTKPRIMIMLVFNAYTGMVVGAGHLPGLRVTLATLAGLMLSSGGGAAMNMWYDRDIDAVMHRTSDRPIPAGIVHPNGALLLGLSLFIASVIVLGCFVNPATAALSTVGFLYYAVFYTMWLNRSTPQNIVIGGGAGAFPPLIGWAAVTGHIGIGGLWLFLIIFLWTPPHFWALALYKNEDYVRARIPMMPAVKGPRSTKRQSLGYAFLLFLTSVTLPYFARVGSLYEPVAIIVGITFLYYTFRMWRETDHQFVWSKRTFLCSLAYLPLLFLAMAPV